MTFFGKNKPLKLSSESASTAALWRWFQSLAVRMEKEFFTGFVITKTKIKISGAVIARPISFAGLKSLFQLFAKWLKMCQFLIDVISLNS